MRAERTNPRRLGHRWTVTEARPLLPAAQELLEKVRKGTKSITAHMSLVEFPSQNVVPFAAIGANSSLYRRSEAIVKERIARRALEKRQPEFIADIQTTEEWRAAKKVAEEAKDRLYLDYLHSYRSEATIPLLGSHRAGAGLGAINLHHPDCNYYTPERVRSIADFIEAAARAIENALSYQDCRQQPSWKDGLEIQAVNIIAHSLDVQSLCDYSVRKALELSHAECAALWLLHPPTAEWHLAALVTDTPVLPGDVLNSRALATTGIRGQVFQTKRPYYCRDTVGDPLWSRCVSGVRSCYTMPLFHDGRLFAVLCVDSYRLDAFDETLREVLDLFVRLLGTRLGIAFRASQERVEETYSLDLLRAVNREDLCRRAVDRVRSLVGAESASLFLLQGGPERSAVLAATTGLAPDFSKDFTYRLGEGITGWVAQRRVPLRLRNCGDKEELRRWDEHLQWLGRTREVASQKGYERPLLVVPVLDLDGRCLGVFRASGKQDGTEFLEEDLILLQQCAGVLARELVEADDDPRLACGQGATEYLQSLLEQACRKCAATAGSVGVVQQGFLINVGHVGALEVTPQHLSRSLAQGSVTTLCAKSGLVQLVQDVTDERWRAIYEACFRQTQSELAVPVVWDGKVLAVLNLESEQISHFTPEHQARAQRHATRLALHLQDHPFHVSPIELALVAFRRDLPELLKTHAGFWVAYSGTERYGPVPTKWELYERCLEKGWDRADFIAGCVEPEVDEIVVGPGMARVDEV